MSGLHSAISRDAEKDKTAILQAIERRVFSPLFQPIVHLPSGKIIGHEGLIRGPSDTDMHLPEKLFDVADELGITMKLENACRIATALKFADLRLGTDLFLNVSPRSLREIGLGPSDLVFLLTEHGINPCSVVLEITERQALNDYLTLTKLAQQSRDHGLRIAIDDLGEGFSNLKLWAELKPEFIKIDKYFITGIQRDTFKSSFVRAIMDVAAHGNTTVIAEGIETQHDIDVISDFGISYGQGYFLGMPTASPN